METLSTSRLNMFLTTYISILNCIQYLPVHIRAPVPGPAEAGPGAGRTAGEAARCRYIAAKKDFLQLVLLIKTFYNIFGQTITAQKHSNGEEQAGTAQ